LRPHEWKNQPEHIKTGLETELKQIADFILLHRVPNGTLTGRLNAFFTNILFLPG
jgi:hypothetical protein